MVFETRGTPAIGRVVLDPVYSRCTGFGKGLCVARKEKYEMITCCLTSKVYHAPRVMILAGGMEVDAPSLTNAIDCMHVLNLIGTGAHRTCP